MARLSRNDLHGPSGRLRSTWQVMKTPYETYAGWQKLYGRTFLIRAMNGDVIATSNTENIRRVLSARHDEIRQFAIGTLTPLIGENSVLIVDGQRHKRARTLLSPPFKGEALRGSIDIMETIARRVTADWKAGNQVRVMDASLEFSLEVIIQVVFGVQQLEQVLEFKQAIRRYVKSFRPVFAFSKMLQHRWYPQWSRFLHEKESFNTLLDNQIGQRRNDTKNHADILARLMAATDESGKPLNDDELKDHLITLLFAGHETTQIGIAWAMSWVHRSPDVLNRLRGELDDVATLESGLDSELLDGVCMEALRLNPIVADFLRVMLQPCELEEIQLPANSTIGIMTCLVHQDPEIYQDPGKFDPDRWNNRSYKPYEFLAFGGGVRRCIGANMAILEMKVALITWLRKFEFQLPVDAPAIEPVHRRNLTMAPLSGIPLQITQVRDSH